MEVDRSIAELKSRLNAQSNEDDDLLRKLYTKKLRRWAFQAVDDLQDIKGKLLYFYTTVVRYWWLYLSLSA